MRVFVTGTGRCGTSTFYQACRHVRNYTCGHETFAGVTHDFEYPDKHIEVASQMAIAIPRMIARYPDAKWVHLVRDREPCVASLARQCWDSMECFSRQWFLCSHPVDVMTAAGSFYDYTNDLIRSLIAGADHRTIRIETAVDQWGEFAEWIGGHCINEAAYQELRRAYNPGVERGRDSYLETSR